MSNSWKSAFTFFMTRVSREIYPLLIKAILKIECILLLTTLSFAFCIGAYILNITGKCFRLCFLYGNKFHYTKWLKLKWFIYSSVTVSGMFWGMCVSPALRQSTIPSAHRQPDGQAVGTMHSCGWVFASTPEKLNQILYFVL